MSEDRLELEQELLLTSTKAQMINKYIDELEENEILTKQWLKTTQELDKYKNIVNEIEKCLNEVPNNNADGIQYGRESLAKDLQDLIKELKGE